jgi:hypothetical protein
VRLGLGRLGRGAHDLEPHGARPGEGDDVDARVAHERRPGIAVAGQQGQGVTGHSGGVECLHERPGAGRGLLCRLEHGGVPGGERRGRHPARDRQREVPGGDHRSHPARRVPHRVALAGRLQQLPAALQLYRLARVVLEEVDRLAHVGVRLGPWLRALAHLQGSQLESPLAQVCRRTAQDRCTLRGGPGAPLAESLDGRVDGGGRLARTGAPGACDHAIGGPGVGGVDALGRSPFAADQDRHLERQASVEAVKRLDERIPNRRAAQLQDGLVAKAHGAARSCSIGTPRC